MEEDGTELRPRFRMYIYIEYILYMYLADLIFFLVFLGGVAVRKPEQVVYICTE